MNHVDKYLSVRYACNPLSTPSSPLNPSVTPCRLLSFLWRSCWLCTATQCPIRRKIPVTQLPACPTWSWTRWDIYIKNKTATPKYRKIVEEHTEPAFLCSYVALFFSCRWERVSFLGKRRGSPQPAISPPQSPPTPQTCFVSTKVSLTHKHTHAYIWMYGIYMCVLQIRIWNTQYAVNMLTVCM